MALFSDADMIQILSLIMEFSIGFGTIFRQEEITN